MTLQSILGSNYKWFYVVIFYYKTHISYLKDTFVRGFAELFGLASSIFVWFITTESNPNFNTKEIITYLLAGFAYTAFTSTWYAEDLGHEIKTGNINASLLRPTSKFLHNFFEYIGRGVLAEILTTFIPLFLILPFIYTFVTLPTLTNLIFTILFIPISYFIKHCVETIFGCIAFWLTNFGGALRLKDKIMFLFEGSKIPLDILSLYFVFVLFTPFAFILHYPIQIYLNKYDFPQIVQTYLGGILWCVILYLLARLIFRLGLKKSEAIGL